MDRNSTFRWMLIAGAMAAMYFFFFQKKPNGQAQDFPTETYVNAPGFAPDVIDVEPDKPAPRPPPAGEILRN